MLAVSVEAKTLPLRSCLLSGGSSRRMGRDKALLHHPSGGTWLEHGLVTLAELGDKTFFMALILAAKHRARDVFIGAFAALTAVTLISLGLGYGLKELLPSSAVPWLAAVLFAGFGVKLLLDAQRMAANEAEVEEQEAEKAVAEVESRSRFNTAWAVIWEAFALVFIAELGDRTQFTTIFLATAPAFTFAGLLAGTLAGHGLVTGLAVMRLAG